MLRLTLASFLVFFTCTIFAQKKPLDHTVYDGWQHIGEQMISNDGKWVVYIIEPQQGDNELVIESSDAQYKMMVPRGYNAVITEDSRYAIFKIKPFFAVTREAKIKKKRPDDMPKDSLAIVELGRQEVWKTERVKGYKTPGKSYGWVAYHLEKKIMPPSKGKPAEAIIAKRLADSLNHIIDSLEQVIQSIPRKEKKKKDDETIADLVAKEYQLPAISFAEGDEPANTDTGTDLVLRKLETGEETIFNNVLEYYFSKTGGKLLVEQAKDPKDSTSNASVILYDLNNLKATVLSKGGNTFKNFSMTDDGSQVAYVAERDAKPKDLQKFYRLWYYKQGMDSAVLLVDKHSEGMQLGYTVSEYASLDFSKSGNRLFFGTAPIEPPKDTTLVDFENAKVDIWHYSDDYLQTVQLTPNRLRAESQRSYLAVYDFLKEDLQQLGSIEIPQIIKTNEGDGGQFVGVTDVGKRIESQWTGNTKKDIYAINVNDGSKKLVKNDLQGIISPQYISPTGKYIMWYDSKARNYFVWDGKSTKNISAKVKYPLWNERNDIPADPSPYGVMGWLEGDSAVNVYDRYDIWQLDPNGKTEPVSFLGIQSGRSKSISTRYMNTDPDERFINPKELLLRRFSEITKESSYAPYSRGGYFYDTLQPYSFGRPVKARNRNSFLYTKESFINSPDLYIVTDTIIKHNFPKTGDWSYALKDEKLSSINPQQSNYLWGTAELFKWKAYNGKESTGIVYKPENFDPKKKYPMITYFYERLSDNLYDYKEPAPIRSAINVSFFVSRGYIIFMPDIEYTTGHPGKNAYDYIVSGVRAVVKKGWADSTKLAIQGHSWGGYQAAQLATMTKLFKAVWAGAPVANMTSAYGGIRWESGMNRQFQYEKTQSRIGATLWERPDLYIENSPLFHLDKVTAPIVILHNDADGAVPWYQGIELFTGLRRLGKKVWMFDYNGEGHGLTKRQDMLDYQIRMQQFFDWILKGAKPAKWITQGVPAVDKGKDWGLEIVD